MTRESRNSTAALMGDPAPDRLERAAAIAAKLATSAPPAPLAQEPPPATPPLALPSFTARTTFNYLPREQDFAPSRTRRGGDDRRDTYINTRVNWRAAAVIQERANLIDLSRSEFMLVGAAVLTDIVDGKLAVDVSHYLKRTAADYNTASKSGEAE